MGRDFSEEVVMSNLAFRVVKQLKDKGESYPTEIAEDLDSSYSSLNNYRKGLEEREIIQKTREEGKKQYYELNEEAILGLWEEEWLELFDYMYEEDGEGIWNYHVDQIYDKEVETPVELVSTDRWKTFRAIAQRFIGDFLETEVEDQEISLHIFLVDDFLRYLVRSLECVRVIEPDADVLTKSSLEPFIDLMTSAYIKKPRHGEEAKKTNKETLGLKMQDMTDNLRQAVEEKKKESG